MGAKHGVFNVPEKQRPMPLKCDSGVEYYYGYLVHKGEVICPSGGNAHTSLVRMSERQMLQFVRHITWRPVGNL